MRDNLPTMLRAAAKEWREKNKVVATGATRYDAALEEAAETIETMTLIIDGLNETSKMADKTCGNCIQCEKYISSSDGKEKWSCENYYYGVGMPYDVYPPHDEACPNWTDNPKDKDKPTDKELDDMYEYFKKEYGENERDCE